MRDATGLAYRRLMQTAEGLSGYLGGRGYGMIDTPMLEDTELFVRKSGAELTSRLYTFTDPGGRRVSLRPEFTSSVIRHFIQERGSIPIPVRWQYNGPVFRYQRGNDAQYHQFNQVGAELIGAGGVEADIEVLSLAWEGLQETGLQDYRMSIGHIGVLNDLLAQYGLSEPAKLFVISNVQGLRSGHTNVARLMRQAGDAGLLSTSPVFALGQNGVEIGPETTREHVQRELEKETPSPFGRRTPDQIVDRLLRKAEQADAPERLEAGLAMVSELARIDDSPVAALKTARAIVKAGDLKVVALDELDQTVDELGNRGIDEDRMAIDFGLASGISYYTGVIFRLVGPAETGKAVLGSGGRYDGLVKALGGEEVAALGFAYDVDQVLEAMAAVDSRGPGVLATSSIGKKNNASSSGS